MGGSASTNCDRPHSCGDGIVDNGQNGTVDRGEHCDGNPVNGQPCPADCRFECVQDNDCDDGNARTNDTCLSDNRCVHEQLVGKFVFVTSTSTTGLKDVPGGVDGGLTGADVICQTLAAAAGLPGTYLAWLSTPDASPATRFTRSTISYILVDGSAIATNWTDLTDGSLTRPINLTEQGVRLGSAAVVATNTRPVGSAANMASEQGHCDYWADNSASISQCVGNFGSTDRQWTQSGSSPSVCDVLNCGTRSHLYCFEQ